jgi:mono/diheme cytochrome c family protein
MRSIGVLALVSSLIMASASTLSAQTVDEGIKVYTAQKCRLCHSVGGVGNQKGALDDVGARLTEAEIREWITHPVEMAAKTKSIRKPPMKPLSLSAAQLDSLVMYLLTLKGKA